MKLSTLSDASVLQPLEQRMNQMKASIERMTDAFQSSSARDQSDEAPAIEQRMDRMEESMGDMKGEILVVGHRVVAPSDRPQAIESSSPRVACLSVYDQLSVNGSSSSGRAIIVIELLCLRIVVEWSCHPRHRVVIRMQSISSVPMPTLTSSESLVNSDDGYAQPSCSSGCFIQQRSVY